jgi:hypothetical protein
VRLALVAKKAPNRDTKMYDLLFLALTVAFFAVTLGLAALCERLGETAPRAAQNTSVDR